MAKAVFDYEIPLLMGKLDLTSKKRLIRCVAWSTFLVMVKYSSSAPNIDGD